MRRSILILGALVLALALAGQPAARAGAPAQAGTTPTGATIATAAVPAQQGGPSTPFAPPSTPGGPGNGAPPGPGASGAVPIGVGSTGSTTGGGATAPANLPGRAPNEAVGFFLPICLGIGLICAVIGAFIATRRDTQRAERITGRDAPHVH